MVVPAGLESAAQPRRDRFGRSARRWHAPQGAAFVLRGAAPDAGILPGVQRPAQARRQHGAALAYALGRLDLGQGRARRADREEQVRVKAAAGGVVTPVRALGPRRAPWVR